MIRFDDLDDRFMRHICRFRDLGEFDRADWERTRAYAKFRADHHRRMVDRDEAERLRAQKEQQAQPRQTTSD